MAEQEIESMKEHAHQMLDQLDASQLAAVAHLLEVLTDPIARSLANAPFDADPSPAEEGAELDEAHAAIQRGEGIAHDDILREYGIIR